MQILGIRTSLSSVRYAILEWDGVSGSLLNAAGETKLDFPRDKTTIATKLQWLREELNRVLRQNSSVTRMAIKCNEYGRGGEKASSREAAHLDAAALIVAGERMLPVQMLFYRSIGTKRDEVKEFAERNVGRVDSNWNEQIADAIAVAWAARNN
jgi:Holliday junction resolvasome RuvABC endonuclease subunit